MRAFTLIELLIVVSIIMLLLSLIGVVAYKVRIGARKSRCKAMMKRIDTSMEEYMVHWREYPSGAPSFPETWPDPYDKAGVELDRRFLTDRDPGAKFQKEDLCSAAGHDMYFLDPWMKPGDPSHKHPRYRKVTRTRYLAWSLGPDQADQIGADLKERNGDDISNIESDY